MTTGPRPPPVTLHSVEGVTVAVNTPAGLFGIDVRRFGFLSADEARRDPDWWRYAYTALREAGLKP